MKRATRWLLIIVLAALAVAGCGNAAIPTGNAAFPTSNAVIPADTQITLDRGMCFGTCPVYSITISANGTIIYEGKKFVQTNGVVRGQVTPDQVYELLLAFDAIDYGSYRDSYVHPSECPVFGTDRPLVGTSLTRDGATKSVAHAHGCTGFAGKQALIDLENRIDAVTGTNQWIGDK